LASPHLPDVGSVVVVTVRVDDVTLVDVTVVDDAVADVVDVDEVVVDDVVVVVLASALVRRAVKRSDCVYCADGVVSRNTISTVDACPSDACICQDG
jgi:hypothetical protein